MIPPLLNDFIGLQKDTALVSVLGVIEALQQANIDSSATFNFTPVLRGRGAVPRDHHPADPAARLPRRARAPAQTGGRCRRVSDALVVEGLHKSFGDTEVLHGIDLSVAEHEVVCLIGASGSGKSTLLRCINLLEPIDAGRIVVGGRDVTSNGVDVNRVRRSIGIVFQAFNLFPHMTVLRNVDARPAQGAGVADRTGPSPRRWSCSRASASPTSATTTPTGSRAASSSAPRSCGRSR